MIQGGSGTSFPTEPLQHCGILGDQIGQEFESHHPAQLDVLGLVDHTHPATAQLLNDAVVRDGLADHAQECYGGSLSKSMKATELAVFQQGQISKVPAFLDRARWR